MMLVLGVGLFCFLVKFCCLLCFIDFGCWFLFFVFSLFPIVFSVLVGFGFVVWFVSVF